MRILIMVLVLIVPSVSLAEYQDIKLVETQKNSHGDTVYVYEFTGNNREPTERRGYVPQSADKVAAEMWADGIAKELEKKYAISQAPFLKINEILVRRARPVVVVPVE